LELTVPLLDLPITASMLTAGLLLGFIGLGGPVW
jgi:hypothetical protein